MTSKNRTPQWWQLYVGMLALVGLFLPETEAVLTETEHVIAEFGILLLIFGFVQLWLRLNRAALMHLDEEEGHWKINVHHFPPERLVARDDMEEERRARPALHFPATEIKGVLSDTLEWPVPENEASVFAHGRAVRRKE